MRQTLIRLIIHLSHSKLNPSTDRHTNLCDEEDVLHQVPCRNELLAGLVPNLLENTADGFHYLQGELHQRCVLAGDRGPDNKGEMTQ